jgi:hypothetical protein
MGRKELLKKTRDSNQEILKFPLFRYSFILFLLNISKQNEKTKY